MNITDDDIIAMLNDGITTVPDMTFHLMRMEPIPPALMDYKTWMEYRRVSQQLWVRMNKLRKWKEVEVVVEGNGPHRITVWRAVA